MGAVVVKLLDGKPAGDVSPLHHLVRGMPPILIVHGTEDEIVPMDQPRRACAALCAHGNACELVELPRQHHSPQDPEQARRALEAVGVSRSAL